MNSNVDSQAVVPEGGLSNLLTQCIWISFLLRITTCKYY